MQETIHINVPGKHLRPDKSKKNAVDTVFDKLGHSGYGRSLKKTTVSMGRDNFSVTGLISELLSPACGMTDAEKQAYLAKIRAKLERGEKLTAEEMRFLQAEDPILYQQAARVMAMREALENQLKHCSSKEEAEAIYSTAVSSVSEEDPMKTCIIAAYENVMEEFKKSDEYKNLPDTEEEGQ